MTVFMCFEDQSKLESSEPRMAQGGERLAGNLKVSGSILEGHTY